MKKALQITKQTFSEFSEDNVLRLSAALAYYSIFSLGPLLIIIVGVAGIVLGQSGGENVRHQIQEALQSLLGPQSAKVVESMMSNQTKSGGIVTTVVGVVTLLLGASGVFGQLQDALNTIWGVKAKPGIGIWGFLRARFISFSMIAGMCFLLLVSLLIEGILKGLSHYLQTHLPGGLTIAVSIYLVFDFAIVVLL